MTHVGPYRKSVFHDGAVQYTNRITPPYNVFIGTRLTDRDARPRCWLTAGTTSETSGRGDPRRAAYPNSRMDAEDQR